jgi:carboxypeptidase C (cathepsin A)
VHKKTQNEKDALQIAVCASEFVQSCESLLRLTADLKSNYMLYDYERIRDQYEQKAKFYKKKADKERNQQVNVGTNGQMDLMQS